MQFRLTYEGPLRPSSNRSPNAAHKHEIRKAFHPQLRNLWKSNINLQSIWKLPTNYVKNPLLGVSGETTGRDKDDRLYIDYLADNFAFGGYRIVPLVTDELGVWCGLEILYLRYTPPGGILHAGDIDNRIKTLFDALKRPTQLSDFGSDYHPPGPEENPFFVLLEDDSLVARLSVETDTMLEPLTNTRPSDADARLVITVTVRPYVAKIWNMCLA